MLPRYHTHPPSDYSKFRKRPRSFPMPPLTAQFHQKGCSVNGITYCIYLDGELHFLWCVTITTPGNLGALALRLRQKIPDATRASSNFIHTSPDSNTLATLHIPTGACLPASREHTVIKPAQSSFLSREHYACRPTAMTARQTPQRDRV